jgi:hypothetical protein
VVTAPPAVGPLPGARALLELDTAYAASMTVAVCHDVKDDTGHSESSRLVTGIE